MTQGQTPTFVLEGVRIGLPNMTAAVTSVIAAICEGRAFSIFTLNMDHCVKLRRNAQFRDAYGRARFVTADGAPIVMLARLFGIKLERAAGSDLVDPLCAQAAVRGIRVFLFGTTSAVLEAASARLRERHPGLTISGLFAPSPDFDPFSEEADDVVARIVASGAQLCFFALGAPKQEVFADRAAGMVRGVAFACVGAGLDFVVGEQVRAPVLFRRMGLEWLWRLVGSPRRLAARYMSCAVLLARYLALAPMSSFSSGGTIGRA